MNVLPIVFFFFFFAFPVLSFLHSIRPWSYAPLWNSSLYTPLFVLFLLATYGGHMELSAFAHMTRRDIKVVQPGLVYVIEWRAGAQVETGSSTSASASGSGSTGSGSTLGTTTAEGEAQTPRRRSLRTPGASGSVKSPNSGSGSGSASGATGKEVRRVKTGRGYYVVEEVSSDEEEDEGEGDKGGETEGKPEEREREEESGGPTVYVA